MKKIITLMAIAFLMAGAAFAGEKNHSEVPSAIKNDFNEHFMLAKDLRWESGSTFYKASFDQDNKHLYAFYTIDDCFLGVSRNLNFGELPLSLQKNIGQKYPKYWISDIVEFSTAEGTTYYMNVRNADEVITLKGEKGYWETTSKMDII